MVRPLPMNVPVRRAWPKPSDFWFEKLSTVSAAPARNTRYSGVVSLLTNPTVASVTATSRACRTTPGSLLTSLAASAVACTAFLASAAFRFR